MEQILDQIGALAMKKLIFLGSALMTLPLTAHAADLYTPPAVYDPVPLAAQSFNWAGFYVGGNVSYLWADSYLFETTGAGRSATFSRGGFVGGGQVGYNYQTGPWVLGVAADIQYSDASGSSTEPLCGPTCEASLEWFGTVRGRVGYAMDNWLFYATGGWAYGGVEDSVAGAGVTSSETLTGGWTAGGGVEVGFAGNWTARAEYLYMDLGESDSGAPFNLGGNYDENHIFRIGVNYLFN